MMARAIPAPGVFINKEKVMNLYNQICEAFPDRDYVFNIESEKPMLGFLRLGVDILVINKETGVHIEVITLPSFVADGSHILSIEEFFEYELKFIGIDNEED